MSTEVTLPALGESVSEGTVSRWLKAVGDQVEADEAIVEVSTDKVDTEIPSPVAGVLLEIRVNEDDVAPVGAVLAVIGDASEAGAASGGDAPAAEPEDAPAEEATSADTPGAPEPDTAAAAPASGGAAEGTEVVLPALGESVTEGTVARWLKAVGDEVEADEAIVEVSTDKVDTEIPSPVAGTLLEIRVNEDDVAAVGAVLGVVGTPSAAPAAPAAPAEPAKPAAAPAPAAPAAAPAPAAPAPAASAPAASAPAAPAAAAPAASDDSEPVYVTPLVRKLAQENGIDLAQVKGTGIGGRIRKQDVLALADSKKAPAAPAAAAPAAPAAAPAAPATPAAAPASKLRGTTEKMTRIRGTIAKRMVESLQTSAQLTAAVEVDLTAISALRKQHKDAFKRDNGVSLSYLPFITKATVEALRQFPKINAEIDTDAGTITYHDAENIGIAVDTERGLMVPVVKDAGDLNITGLAKKIGDLASRARSGKIGPDELSGGTFTITNYGSAGTLFDTPIINLPQAAILGTGALVKRPVVVSDQFGNDTIAVRDMMFLSMSYDHRLVDGADAARFLSAVKARLEAGDFASDL